MRAIVALLPPVIAAIVFGFANVEWPWLMQGLGVAPETRLARWGETVVATLTALAVAWTINRALHVLLWRGLLAAPGRPALPRLLTDMVGALVYVLALALLGEWHFRAELATGALATSGILVAVVGFAVRDIIADIFSGLNAQLERPYGIGDWIEFQGKVGQVVEISWRATRLVTQEELTVVVPNGLLARQPYINYSLPRRHFRDAIKVRLDPAVPAERARRILLAAARSANGVRSDPPPDIKLIEFERQAALYHIRFWVDDYRNLQPARDAVAGAVLDHLDKAGLGLARDEQEVILRRDGVGGDTRLSPEQLLRRVDLFEALNDQDFADLVRGLKLRRVSAGAALVREGDPGQSLFVLSEGLLDVEAKDVWGGMRPLARLSPGGVVGEISLLTGTARSATVIARTDSVLYEIDAEAFRPVLERRPALAEELSSIVAGRLQRNAALNEPGPAGTPAEAERPLAGRILDRMRTFFGI
jgi:small-conductance mechanosensitive channel/CRP-like cAMP-binding protein